MKNIRLAILLILAVLQVPGIRAGQPIPEFTGSQARYAATPDTNNSAPLFVPIFTWSLSGGYNDTVTYSNGDSIDIHWGTTPGYFALGVSQSTNFNIPGITSSCPGDFSWDTIQLIEILGDTSINEGDTFKFRVTMSNTFDSIVWNKTLKDSVYSGVAKTTDTVYVDVYTNGLKGSGRAIMTVHPLPRFYITYNSNIIKDTMLCGNDSIIISAGKLDTTLKYKWSTGDTTRTLQIHALSPSYPKAADTLWVVVTNKYHGHYTDTFVLKRCNSFTVAMKVINNMVPKNGRNAGTAAKFNVWIINATIAATDSFTVWYYVENDNLDTTSVTFGAGQQSGIVSIKTNPYNSYFTGNANKSNDVERTVVILKAQISSREMVQIQKGATTSDKFYILHKSTIKEIKYVP